MWPAVRRAVDFVARPADTPRGEIALGAGRGTACRGRYALLTGCASIHQSLRCAVALAELAGRPAAGLGARGGPARARGGPAPGGVRGQEPVLHGLVLPGARRRGPRPGRGPPDGGGVGHVRGSRPRRPVRQRRAVGDRAPRPASWCIALDALRRRATGRWTLFASVQHLRHAGRLLLDRLAVRQPGAVPAASESSWTAAAVVLAADALAGFSGGAGIFRDAADEAGQPGGPDRAAGASRRAAPREPNGPGGQPMPSPVRSSRRSEPSPGTSVNAPDFSARW